MDGSKTIKGKLVLSGWSVLMDCPRYVFIGVDAGGKLRRATQLGVYMYMN